MKVKCADDYFRRLANDPEFAAEMSERQRSLNGTVNIVRKVRQEAMRGAVATVLDPAKGPSANAHKRVVFDLPNYVPDQGNCERRIARCALSRIWQRCRRALTGSSVNDG
jgi:hypothetical protein